MGGIPAKIIRYRFSEKQIESLLSDKWWEKDIKWIKKNADYFSNIDSYLRFVQDKM